MIETLAPHGTDEPFAICVLPRRPRGRESRSERNPNGSNNPSRSSLDFRPGLTRLLELYSRSVLLAVTPLEGLVRSCKVLGPDEEVSSGEGGIHATGVVGPDHRLNPDLVQDALGDLGIGSGWERGEGDKLRGFHGSGDDIPIASDPDCALDEQSWDPQENIEEGAEYEAECQRIDGLSPQRIGRGMDGKSEERAEDEARHEPKCFTNQALSGPHLQSRLERPMDPCTQRTWRVNDIGATTWVQARSFRGRPGYLGGLGVGMEWMEFVEWESGGLVRNVSG